MCLHLILSRPELDALDMREREITEREKELDVIQSSTTPHLRMDKLELLLVIQSKFKIIDRQRKHSKPCQIFLPL